MKGIPRIIRKSCLKILVVQLTYTLHKSRREVLRREDAESRTLKGRFLSGEKLLWLLACVWKVSNKYKKNLHKWKQTGIWDARWPGKGFPIMAKWKVWQSLLPQNKYKTWYIFEKKIQGSMSQTKANNKLRSFLLQKAIHRTSDKSSRSCDSWLVSFSPLAHIVWYLYQGGDSHKTSSFFL